MSINGVTNMGFWCKSMNIGLWQDSSLDLSTDFEASVESTGKFTIIDITNETKLSGTPSIVSQFSGELEKLP